MKYYLYLDETGDHGLSFIDKNFPIFLLCGCMFSESENTKLNNELNNFKIEFFNTTEVILHSRDIRKCEGAFQILFDLEIKKRFYERLNSILANLNYTIISSCINKNRLIERYGKDCNNPYSISLSYIIERSIFFLDNQMGPNELEILVEERGRKEDTQLLAHFNSIKDRGTYYISQDRLKAQVKSFKFHNKRENINGLQISDLCAYPLARKILSPKSPYIPFEIIESKLYRSNKGEISGFGIKIFP